MPETTGPGIITMATGPEKYTRFALALANSLRQFERWEGPIAVVSDKAPEEFGDLFDTVIEFNPAFGPGVEQKLSLDRYTPYAETIFIDCDSLVFRSLDEMVELFRKSGEEFGVLAGGYVYDGDEHYNVPDVGLFLRTVGIEKLPAFNSGVIWWTPGGARIFDEARKVAASMNDGVTSAFKTARMSDEPIFGAAMERLGVEYAGPRSDYLLPTVAAKSLRRLDVVRGVSTTETNGGVVNPMVVHFNYAGQDSLTYARERTRATSPEQSRFAAVIRSFPSWLQQHGWQWARRRLKAIL